jgi:hypothetical protein
MEPCDIAVESHDFTDARRVISECWIYTAARGLRAMIWHGNGSSIAVDGQRLARWCILDESIPRRIVAFLYCADSPGPALRDRVIQLATARFTPILSPVLGAHREESRL